MQSCYSYYAVTNYESAAYSLRIVSFPCLKSLQWLLKPEVTSRTHYRIKTDPPGTILSLFVPPLKSSILSSRAPAELDRSHFPEWIDPGSLNSCIKERGQHAHPHFPAGLLVQWNSTQGIASNHPKLVTAHGSVIPPVKLETSFVLWILLNIPKVCHKTQCANTLWILRPFY